MATEEDVLELRGWLKNLTDQVQQLRVNQYIFDEVQKIVETNTELHRPSHFYTWMQDMYVAAIAMAIRRQLDDDTRTMSFFRFLKRIKGDPSVVSRRRYRALFRDDNRFVQRLKQAGDLERYVDGAYDRIVGAGKQQPSADDIDGEIRDLQETAKKFVEFANKVIAHAENAKPESLPSFEEVSTVIGFMESLLQRYIQLFEATHQSMDVNFAYDWKAPFRFVWLPTRGYVPW
jgi:hypothetical protein